MQHADTQYMGELEEELQTAVLETIPVEKRLRGLPAEERLRDCPRKNACGGCRRKRCFVVSRPSRWRAG